MVRVRTPSGGGPDRRNAGPGWCAGSDAPSAAGVYRRPVDRASYAPPLVRNPFASPLWRNAPSARLAAATISIFGSLITRLALPFVAILVLGSGAIEVALLRGVELVAALVFGLVAGAWVDRLRRRPVLIWADLGRAVLLASIPVAFALGVLTFPQLLVVSGLTAILTTFFDAADNAYLPTIVERDRLVDANTALSASGSVSEFAAFGITGFLVQILTAPIAIAIDSVTLRRLGDAAGDHPAARAAAAATRRARARPGRDPRGSPARPPRSRSCARSPSPRCHWPRCSASSARSGSCSSSRTCTSARPSSA